MRALRWIILIFALVALVEVPAAAQEVYFVPQQNSALYPNTVDVEIRIDASVLKSGQLNITYDPACANITQSVNATDFPFWGWTHHEGSEWITFYTEQEFLTGNYRIGMLTIQCVNDSPKGCTTPLEFAMDHPLEYSALFDDYGHKIAVTWINGTFGCEVFQPPHTDVNVTVDIELSDPSEIEDLLPPGTDLSNAVVINITVLDQTPEDQTDDAYTDITIDVGGLDVNTCMVYKEETGFLPEVADVTTLPTTKPPGNASFSRDVANNSVIIRLYVGDPLLGIMSVESLQPIADVNGPYVGNEGSPIRFDGSGSTDPNGDIESWFWDLNGDGLYETDATPGQGVVSHTWGDDHSGKVSLKVIDGVGLTDTNDTTVTVLNVAPTADLGNDGPKDEGSAVTISFSNQHDPGTQDTFTYSLDWNNDGIYELIDQPSASTQYTWYDEGTYTIKGKIKDDDGGYTEYTTEVTVNNVAPLVETGDDRTVNEGEMVSFSGSFTDPGTQDTHTIEWDFGDGSTARDTLTPTHVYYDKGDYTVTLNVIDNDGGIGTDTLAVTVKPVQAKVIIEPKTINLKSKGVFIAFIRLPKGYSAKDINRNTVVCGGAPAIGGFGFRNTFIAWFSVQKLVDVPTGNAVILTVTGRLSNGASFEGSDTVRVIDRGGKK